MLSACLAHRKDCLLSPLGQGLCAGNLPEAELHLRLQESVHGPWTRAGHLWENTQPLKTRPAPAPGPHRSLRTPSPHLLELLEGEGHTIPLSPVDIGKGPLADSVALVKVLSCLGDICFTPEKPVSGQT